MKLKIFISIMFFVALFIKEASAYEGAKELSAVESSDSRPAFRVAYSEFNDPDGPSYLITFRALVDDKASHDHFLVNYYSVSEKKFIFSWDFANEVHLQNFQIKENQKDLIVQFFNAQKNLKNDVEIVFSKDDGESVQYYFSLAKLCSKFALNFKNITNPDKKCDQ
ncbi:MAG: hypothetical protein KA116_01900 [Proteobacteria bacterium]|nr:hypothetical protein [Pseudomonadota bacterium]